MATKSVSTSTPKKTRSPKHKGSASSSSSSLGDSNAVWEFQTKTGWGVFPSSSSSVLEKGKAEGKDHVKLKISADGKDNFYLIDLRKMVQTNLSTKFRRKIRRRTLDGSKGESSSSSSSSSSKDRPLEEIVAEITNWKIVPSAEVPKEEETCSICLDSLHELPEDAESDSNAYEVVRLSQCGGHHFHKSCILACFDKHQMFLRCPICTICYGERRGDCPSGEMRVKFHKDQSCQGYEGQGVIEIEYELPNGIQGPEHVNPGELYSGTYRVCYLPDTAEGREVLRKLRIAWERKLTFTVGTSVTSGKTNTVVWAGIHHKTSLVGGPTSYGWPDPTYFDRVSIELADKGVF